MRYSRTRDRSESFELHETRNALLTGTRPRRGSKARNQGTDGLRSEISLCPPSQRGFLSAQNLEYVVRPNLETRPCSLAHFFLGRIPHPAATMQQPVMVLVSHYAVG
jgi:hypothetical protein